MREVGGFSLETLLVEKHRLDEVIEKGRRRGYRYIAVVKRQNEQDGSLSLYLIHPLSKPDCKKKSL